MISFLSSSVVHNLYLSLSSAILPLTNSFLNNVKQSLNAAVPMLVTVLGMITLLREVQPSNAPGSIEVTAPRFIDVKLVQPAKASKPIVLNDIGNVIEVNPVQLAKTGPAILVIEEGIDVYAPISPTFDKAINA